MTLNLLGPYQFHVVKGAPKYTWRQISMETRDGLDGVSLWYHGRWGKPFQLMTLTYTIDFEIATYLAAAYQDATELDPLPLVLGSVMIPRHLYQVIEVDPFEPRALVDATGQGVPSPCHGSLRAIWTLQPIYF